MKRRELEQLLEEHDMPVEKKTLYQDFAALGDVCGLQLESEILGHSDKAVTLRMYTHADQASMTRANNIFREAIKRKQV